MKQKTLVRNLQSYWLYRKGKETKDCHCKKGPDQCMVILGVFYIVIIKL